MIHATVCLDTLAWMPTIKRAGIIGLLTARELLRRRLSVALVEREQLCAGATGAGGSA
jgi:ribulose 1,5-bisphosphate synthetase/thiazole synthase